MKLIKHEDYLKERLKDKKFKKLYKEEKILAELAVKIAEQRQKLGLSQKELAQKLHTSQQVISRWENHNYDNMEIRSLEKIADVLGFKLKISLIPKKRLITTHPKTR